MYRIPFKNIARESGLSTRTLYRVMNNDSGVTDGTRRRALRALNKFGYTSLSQRRDRSILIDVEPQDPFKQPLALELVKTISPECRVIFADSINNRGGFLDDAADASILITLAGLAEPLQKKLRYQNPSCVVINLLCGGGGDLAIDSNDFQGGRLAADHLLDLGCRHVTVASPLEHPNHRDRALAFHARILQRATGTRVDFQTDYRIGQEGPEEFWRRYFRQIHELPDAIFCPLGGLADHLPYYAEKFAGLSIPGDLGIVGYNRPEERGSQQLFQLDTVTFDLKLLVDCCRSFALNPPLLSDRNNALRTLVEPQLIIHGSVRNQRENQP